ncbi:hypothetical protein A1O3_04617 [Capronia epimyces CBS 606.96]|uniref:Major facilitator superfamily (MFS) profile domain-containing protein n=1 Tax=Capronia epimyces CBS 606.96 TaxID=1182542 RepID=W9Y2V2_9EURO|nr:uncharacterized protein A1O3_04617 [Capronia epimyces CBS 606.96]EXJ83950.1 hypothetical protein A1O3_04617 [Capronia epimyces CBS 606.96]
MAEKDHTGIHIENGAEKRAITPCHADLDEKHDYHTAEAGLSEDQLLASVDPHEERKIIRKIDYRLLPLLAVLYLLAYIDRSNIGNAKIAGMQEDLKLGTGLKYNTALTVFFVPYSLLEVPSNIMLKIMRPSIWMAILCFSWGLVMTLMGLVNTYHGLIVARFFLGVAEAGLFPAATYLLTIWYKRYELQKRMAVFYAAASLSGAFSGLLAFAIEKMDGISGLAGWKWIFILEGLLPIAVSFSLYFLLPDRPETARFLTEREREFVINRVALQSGTREGRVTNTDKIGWRHIKVAFSDWKIWVAVIPFGACGLGTYGFTATVPTVVQALGYTSANAQLMTIPIYVFGMIATVGAAFWSDYAQQRTPFIMGGFAVGTIGFIGQLAIPHPELPGVTYFFLFLIAAGLFCPVTTVVTLVGNNLAPSSTRAVGMALFISVGNLGGICGSNVYLARQAPRYFTGFGVGLGACLAGILAAYILRVGYSRENRRRDELLAREGEDVIRARYTEQELLDLGHRSPFYRYTL